MLKSIMNFKSAKDGGFKKYFTGKACPRGHVCERLTVNGDCIECAKLRNNLRYKNNSAYREKMKSRALERYSEDPQKFRDKSNANYLKNPENFRANSANTIARSKGIPGKISGADVLAVLCLQGYECKYCGTSLRGKYEIDHAIALSKRGPNTIDNIQCLCYRCHKNKTKQDLREFFTKKEKPA